jgi:hypothetical protein
MALSFSTTLRNSRLDAISTAVGSSGLLRIYDGTRPANPGTAVSTQVLLAELTCGATFGTSSAGVLTLSAITQDSSANNTGTATWFRITTSGGTAVVDGNVSTSGSDLNLTTTSIVATQPVSISSFTITEGNA